MARVSELLKELPKEEFVPMEERKIYTLEEEKEGFEITKQADIFIVDGPSVQRLMAKVNLEDNESFYYFQKGLEKLGVNEALKKAGVKEGDTVRIVDWELEWYD